MMDAKAQAEIIERLERSGVEFYYRETHGGNVVATPSVSWETVIGTLMQIRGWGVSLADRHLPLDDGYLSVPCDTEESVPITRGPLRLI